MQVKIVLTFVLLGCFWLADGCGRGSTMYPSRQMDIPLRKKRFLGSNDKRQNRSVERIEFYSIKLQTDPCNFNTYDEDMDGVITKSELDATLRKDEETDALFVYLDIRKDGGVTRDEFNEMAPLIIMECFNSGKK